MSTLLEFFRGIGEIIVSIVSFVISMFRDLIYMIDMLVTVVGNVPGYFSWLPPEVLTLLVLLISVVLIYKILGREG